tara:strand:- start:47 stop:310 length:264 start_codon:yes stop_codon:yes gene_type:complete
MKSFKGYLEEGQFPIWLKVTVGGMVMRIKMIDSQIKSESDIKKKIDLLSSQNTIMSYISGLSIAVGSNDKVLMNRLKKGIVGGGRKG